MHGRLKVKTTEEQKKAKQEERAKKLKVYNAATSKAFHKRKMGEFDGELLEITGQVLQANSDFYTFWNMRKETFLHLIKTLESQELRKRCQAELEFLEMCLKTNPKSYGTWNHRRFVLDHMPQPDLARELELCNLFLQYDERNFHCWDYRRFVVKRSNVSAAEEFDFTTSKISSNFSNFSSWHYRSKLLPILHPDPSQPSGISQDITCSEFELVRNGLYTDPDDQSNWFYHKWLLGRGAPEQRINNFFISRGCKCVLLSLTNALKISADNCILLLNKSKVDARWTNQDETSAFSTLWSHLTEENFPQKGDEDVQLEIQVLQGGKQVCNHSLLLPSGKEEASFQWSKSDISSYFRQKLCGVDDITLQRELDSIKELQEVETNNKWAILTMVTLMKAVDTVNYADEITSLLQQLQKIDAPRNNYYSDLRSRFVVEAAIETSESPKILSLKGQNLTTMCHTELLPLLQELNLSDNILRQVVGFSFLQNLQHLNLAGNRLNSCHGLGRLPSLITLDFSNNLITAVDRVQPLSSCRQLKKLTLLGNPVCDEPCASDQLQELFSDVEIHISTENT